MNENKLDLSYIARDFFPNKWNYEINQGSCFVWAELARLINYTKYNVELYTTEEFKGHAFIKINSLYFDAERPQGVKEYRFLPFFKSGKRQNAVVFMQSPKEFNDYWSQWGIEKEMFKKVPYLVQAYKRGRASTAQMVAVHPTFEYQRT